MNIKQPLKNMQNNILKRIATLTTVMLSVVFIAGCGNVDVQLPFMDKIDFTKSGPDPKVQSRGALVLPPSTKRLPNPDEVAAKKAAKTNDKQYWPDDPDLRRKKLAELKKEAKKRKRDEIDMVNGDIDEFDKIQGEKEATTGPRLLDIISGDDDE